MPERKDRTEYHRAWREKNRQRIREQRQAWRAANHEKVRSYQVSSQKQHSAQSLARYHANPEPFKASQREYKRRLRSRVLNAYGNKCECCGESHVEFLAIDHVNGGGNNHRRSLKINGGSEFYRHLIKSGFPKGFRVLCHNCNMAIGAYGYCPHHRS